MRNIDYHEGCITSYIGRHIFLFFQLFLFFVFVCCKINKELYTLTYLDWSHILKQNLHLRIYSRNEHQARKDVHTHYSNSVSHIGVFFGKTFVVIWPEAMRALGWQPFRPQRRTTVLKSLWRPLLVALAYKASDSRPPDNLPSARPDAPVLLASWMLQHLSILCPALPCRALPCPAQRNWDAVTRTKTDRFPPISPVSARLLLVWIKLLFDNNCTALYMRACFCKRCGVACDCARFELNCFYCLLFFENAAGCVSAWCGHLHYSGKRQRSCVIDKRESAEI